MASGRFSLDTSENVVLPYLVLELEKVVVSSYNIGSGGEAQPDDSFRLNFTKITVTPWEVKEGKATKGAVVSYTLAQMQANA